MASKDYKDYRILI